MEWHLFLTLAAGAAFAVPFLVWIARRVRRTPDVRLAPPPEARVLPMLREPEEEALAALPMPMHACPDCGYVGIRPLDLSEGGYAGGGELLSNHVCPHCGYRGPPAEFDDAETYRQYVLGLRQARRTKGP